MEDPLESLTAGNSLCVFGGVNTKKAGADNDQTVNGRRRLFYIVNPPSLSASSHSTAYYVRHRHQP